MTYKRRYKAQSDHLDENQPEIVEELKKRGILVQEGHNDILVYYRKIYQFEIKNPETALKKNGEFKENAISVGQQILNATWPDYHIVTSIEQILSIIGYKEKKNE